VMTSFWRLESLPQTSLSWPAIPLKTDKSAPPRDQGVAALGCNGDYNCIRMIS
jgi:hypothetical protein